MAVSKDPHLVVWKSVLDAFTTRIDGAVSVRDRHQRELLAQLDAETQRRGPALRQAAADIDGLVGAFTRRWHGKTIKRVGVPRLTLDLHTESIARGVRGGGHDAGDPTAAIAAFVAKLTGAMMPVTAKSRAVRFDHERRQALEIIGAACDGEAALARDLAEALVRHAPHAASTLARQRGEAVQANQALHLPPGIGDDISPDLVAVRPGHGPLVVQCGWLHGGSGQALVPAPRFPVGTSAVETLSAPLAAPDIWIPALVDLDRDGGIATTSRSAVTSLLLRLLALLPAGGVKLNVFDPSRLGESVKYLFQLGDAAEKIIGDKVGSTTKELRELLEATERHITYVTQKYLGATHRSLHEYNLAAGEVAEPYRVLVLFDHPTGFDRPGSGVDAELVAQLDKILQAGPRCGVYTVMHRSGDVPMLRRPPSAGQDLATTPWPHLVEPVVRSVATRPAPMFSDALDMAEHLAGGLTALAGGSSAFTWVPATPRPEAPGAIRSLITRIERDLQHASVVEVDPERVGALAATVRADRRAKGLPTGPVVALPSDSSTWWQGDSTAGVLARVGRQGSAEVTEVRLDSTLEHSHLLVGGKPGSGKSVFLHALLSDLTRTFSPTELELYLLDIKFGVEFKAYEASPHARVVALESGREFGVSVLAALEAKMENRSKLFKAQGISKLDEFRPLATRPMPRIVAVIDEFHGLFETDDTLGTEAARLLRRLVKFGRSFGIHLVLASQQITGVPMLPKDALGLIPQRIVFASSAEDSRLLLADDNPEGALLDRPGEGILNLRGGRRDANTRFQATLMERADAARLTRGLARRAAGEGIRLVPVVFDGLVACDLPESVAADLTAPKAMLQPTIPVGMPMGLGGAVDATFRRSGGGNLLVVVGPERVGPVVAMAAARALSGAVDVEVYDFHGAGSALDAVVDQVSAASAARVRAGIVVALARPRGKQLATGLVAAATLVARRHAAGDHRGRPVLLVLSGLEVAADLRAGSPASDALGQVLEDGPAVGVHVIVCVGGLAVVERTLGYGALDHFDLRVVGPLSRDDSNRLIDDPIASRIAPEQLILRDRAVPAPQTLRAFVLPGPDRWKP